MEHTHIVLDLDGVVYDFIGALRRFAHETQGIDLDSMPPANEWNFFGPQWGWSLDTFLETFSDGVRAGEIFWKGAPLPNAVEGWARLRETVDVLHVVTDRSPRGAVQEAHDATLGLSLIHI